jgi:hypothetical protein
LLHSQADFDRMRAKVASRVSPWIDGWNVLAANSHASSSYGMRGPVAVVSRYSSSTAGTSNFALLYHDVAAAYACALRWKVSGETAYADKAVAIMNAWSSTLTGLGGDNDVALLSIQGYQFANAGEIMRGYAGWAAADFARFQNMMLTVFHPVSDYAMKTSRIALTSYSNWQLSSIASNLAIGVLCDRRDIFNEAVTWFKTGQGNGCVAKAVYYLHPGHLGQTQESGRDQGHNTLSIALLATICEMAWNQGVDLYGYDNNRVLAGCEYVAKGNLIESGTSYYPVPFTRYVTNNIDQTTFATGGQGSVRPAWAMIYHHYVNRKGLAAPYSKAFATLTAPEGGGGNYGPNSGGYDQLGYGTLAYSRDAIASGAAPSGLTATVTAGVVTLSWWGSAYATSYRVKRSTTPGGPYINIATGITDRLTHADSGMAAGTYYYVVTAIDSSGESVASNEVSAVTATQLHTRLPFNEGSGTSAADSSGHSNSGTLVGATWATGKSGTAVMLDGSSGYVSLPDGLLTDLGDCTISLWTYWTGINHGVQYAFNFGTGVDQYMMLCPKWSNGKARFMIAINGQAGGDLIESGGRLPDFAWVHVAVTLAGSVGTLYVNGAVAGTNAAMRFQPFRLGPTTQNWIGRSNNAGNPRYRGLVEDFRIYRGALSAVELAALARE